MNAADCKCNMTGWVKARIPASFQGEYGGRSWGWAGCNFHAELATDEPPDDASQPDPGPYEWEAL